MASSSGHITINGMSLPSDLQIQSLEVCGDGVFINGKKVDPTEYGIDVSAPVSYQFLVVLWKTLKQLLLTFHVQIAKSTVISERSVETLISQEMPPVLQPPVEISMLEATSVVMLLLYLEMSNMLVQFSQLPNDPGLPLVSQTLL